MTQVTILSAQGQTVAVVDLAVGESLMHAAVRANVDGIEAECGGCMSCATCHVYVSETDFGAFAPPAPDEAEMLDFVAAERRPTSRLSCQLIGSADLGALAVELPLRQVA